MTLRQRVLIGLFGLIALFLVWGFLAVGAAFFVLDSPSWMVRMAFYAIAGAGWLPFAMPVVSFMARRP
jgi:hypothetical protein